MGKIAAALYSNTAKERFEAVKPIADLIQKKDTVIIEDSNDLQAAFDMASDSNIPNINFLKCGAMSKVYIGHHLQNELIRKKINKNTVKIVNQFFVKKNDKAFKLISSLCSKEKAIKTLINDGIITVVEKGIPVYADEKLVNKAAINFGKSNEHLI